MNVSGTPLKSLYLPKIYWHLPWYAPWYPKMGEKIPNGKYHKMPAKLTDARIRAIKPDGKTHKISDGHGLYIHLTPAGSKLWRLAYTGMTIDNYYRDNYYSIFIPQNEIELIERIYPQLKNESANFNKLESNIGNVKSLEKIYRSRNCAFSIDGDHILRKLASPLGIEAKICKLYEKIDEKDKKINQLQGTNNQSIQNNYDNKFFEAYPKIGEIYELYLQGMTQGEIRAELQKRNRGTVKQLAFLTKDELDWQSDNALKQDVHRSIKRGNIKN